jgi:glycosyltransferase involved in cell wall biosynthesis
MVRPSTPARRLLLVSHRPLEAGGTTRWRHLATALPEHGWTVHAVTAPAGTTGDVASADARVARRSQLRARVMDRVGALARPTANGLFGVQPEAFPPNTAWSFSGRAPIRAALEAQRPDVIVATSPPPAALFAAAATAGGMPFVADLRDPWAGSPFYDAGGSLLTRLERRVLRRADAIVAVTAPMLAELRERHPSLASRMQLVPNGFAPELLADRPVAAPDWSGRPVTLIHPGALYGGRTVADLICAMGEPDLRDHVRLQLLGSVDAESTAAIASTGAPVDVLAPTDWERAIAYIRAADVVVVAQPSELGDAIAWPVKTFEALALGKPVLAITGGGAVEQLLTRLGRPQGCARHGDPASIAEALRRLLADPPAPVPTAELAPWNRSAIAADYASLLDSLVARRTRATSAPG